MDIKIGKSFFKIKNLLFIKQLIDRNIYVEKAYFIMLLSFKSFLPRNVMIYVDYNNRILTIFLWPFYLFFFTFLLFTFLLLHLWNSRAVLVPFYELFVGPAEQILDRWFESDILKTTLATDAVIGKYYERTYVRTYVHTYVDCY